MDRDSLRRALGAASVLLSLLFVGYEVRQNTLVARAVAAQSFSQQIVDFNQVLVADDFPALNARLARGAQRVDFTPEERFRIDIAILSQLRIWESLFRAIESGLVEDEMLRAMTNGPGPFEFPYFEESWPVYRSALTSDFASFLASHLALPGEGSSLGAGSM